MNILNFINTITCKTYYCQFVVIGPWCHWPEGAHLWDVQRWTERFLPDNSSWIATPAFFCVQARYQNVWWTEPHRQVHSRGTDEAGRVSAFTCTRMDCSDSIKKILNFLMYITTQVPNRWHLCSNFIYTGFPWSWKILELETILESHGKVMDFCLLSRSHGKLIFQGKSNFVMNLVILVAVRGGHLYFSEKFYLWLKYTYDFVNYTFDWTPHSYKIVMENLNCVLEKSWNLLFKFVWEPWYIMWNNKKKTLKVIHINVIPIHRFIQPLWS